MEKRFSKLEKDGRCVFSNDADADVARYNTKDLCKAQFEIVFAYAAVFDQTC